MLKKTGGRFKLGAARTRSPDDGQYRNVPPTLIEYSLRKTIWYNWRQDFSKLELVFCNEHTT